MKKNILLAALCILFLTSAMAQNNVGVGTTTPNASAALDVQSTTQGMLVPRMTKAQRDLIATPATGLLVYQTDNTPGFYFYNAAWTSLNDNLGNHTATQALNMNSNNITSVNNFTATGLTKSNLLAIPRKDITISSAPNFPIILSYDIPDASTYSYIRIGGTPSAAFQINGFPGGTDGRILFLHNATTQNMTIINQSSNEGAEPGTSAANKIITQNVSAITTTAAGVCTFIYDASANSGVGAWILISVQQ